mmetsp:Transcript_33495/g.95297  ORF Transcript_33495/g.95297 Transcript_33495/m.95297 type:complete len:225 (+) Transcript_33495:497-1171(+)
MTAPFSQASMTPLEYMLHLLFAPTETTTGPSRTSASISGSALFSGNFRQPTRPNFAPPPPSTVKEPSSPLRTVAAAPAPWMERKEDVMGPANFMRAGQSSCLAWYAKSVSETRPRFAAYSIASSAVAPAQPPVPPQCCGFGVQSTSCWMENWRSVWKSSEWARRTVAEETAQQLPQEPWFITSRMAARRSFHVKSAGSAARSTSRVDTAARPRPPGAAKDDFAP